MRVYWRHVGQCEGDDQFKRNAFWKTKIIIIKRKHIWNWTRQQSRTSKPFWRGTAQINTAKYARAKDVKSKNEKKKKRIKTNDAPYVFISLSLLLNVISFFHVDVDADVVWHKLFYHFRTLQSLYEYRVICVFHLAKWKCSSPFCEVDKSHNVLSIRLFRLCLCCSCCENECKMAKKSRWWEYFIIFFFILFETFVVVGRRPSWTTLDVKPSKMRWNVDGKTAAP